MLDEIRPCIPEVADLIKNPKGREPDVSRGSRNSTPIEMRMHSRDHVRTTVLTATELW